MECELCGSEGAKYKIRIEGAVALVCERCARLGEVIEEIRERPAPKPAVERVEEVAEDIGRIVREKREEMGMEQEELAKRINETQSMIKRIEHGYVPSLAIAHKLEKVLKTRLTEFVAQEDQHYQTGKPASLTLGDVIVLKKPKGG